jgi:hypothetical protein
MDVRLWLALCIVGSSAFASLPCYKLVSAAGTIAQRQAAQPAASEAFSKAVFHATQQVARAVSQPSLVAPFEPFPVQQQVDQVTLANFKADTAAARAKALSALALVGKAAPAFQAPVVEMQRGLFSRLLSRSTAPKTVPLVPVAEPVLPTDYKALPIFVQGGQSILRALDELDVAMERTPAQETNWWTNLTISTVVIWPLGLWRAGEALLDQWAYEHVEFPCFATSVRDAIALGSAPSDAPLNFLVSVRNPAVSYQLVFHWNENSEPMLLGSYAQAPIPAVESTSDSTHPNLPD